jgi:hypothetical protein
MNSKPEMKKPLTTKQLLSECLEKFQTNMIPTDAWLAGLYEMVREAPLSTLRSDEVGYLIATILKLQRKERGELNLTEAQDDMISEAIRSGRKFSISAEAGKPLIVHLE